MSTKSVSPKSKSKATQQPVVNLPFWLEPGDFIESDGACWKIKKLERSKDGIETWCECLEGDDEDETHYVRLFVDGTLMMELQGRYDCRWPCSVYGQRICWVCENEALTKRKPVIHGASAGRNVDVCDTCSV